MRLNIPEKANLIINVLETAGYEAFVVGGCVRDTLLGRTPEDWDITTNASPSEVKKLFRRTVDTGIAHGTVSVLLGKDRFEVTTYRVDGAYADHRHPDEVRFTSSLEEDLKRRDFTINAMAYNPEKGLADPFGGESDLEKKLIRCVGSPHERFEEDALRILRAFRFSAQLGFEIEEKTLKAASEKAPSLDFVSAERICAEFLKLITSDNPAKIVDLYNAGITAYFIPEFDRMMETTQKSPYHTDGVGLHTVKSMEYILPDRLLRLTMLLHDSGKPAVSTFDENGVQHFKKHAPVSVDIARQVMKRLKIDNATISKVCLLVKYHDWRLTPSEENVRRLISVLGKELYLYFVLVQIADELAHSDYRQEYRIERILEEYRTYEVVTERGDCVSLGDMELKGSDLLALGLKSGPEVGVLLDKAFDEVLRDSKNNNNGYLVDFAKNCIKNEEVI